MISSQKKKKYMVILWNSLSYIPCDISTANENKFLEELKRIWIGI